jgi:membrane protein YqaA with SNARE-associated domain
MIKKLYRNILSNSLAFLPIVVFVGISFLIYKYITPERIIDYIGIKNAYFLMLVSAFVGGLTTFIALPYHSILIILVGGKIDPLMVGLSAATGIILGDFVSYSVGYIGSDFMSGKVLKFSNTVRNLIEKHPRAFPIFCFAYGSLSPFSNDFITITSGLVKYPIVKMIVPLGLGNIIFNVTLALTASTLLQ